MNHWKQLLLSGYLLATQRQRRQAAAVRAAQRAAPVSILFYHRVADSHPNSWTMPTRVFARQIDWIAANYEIISLEEAQQRMASGQNHWPSVCLTFDDGYAENCEFALPLLLRKNLPFTYFVASQHVTQGEPFPHDVQAGQPLRPNSASEIRSLAHAGVEIGAHTRTHADLGRIDSGESLREEIAGSKADLEEITGMPVRYFAFPFGLHSNLSQAACRVAYQTSFKGVCSAYGAYNWPGDDPWHLRRIHADPEMVRLKNWLTVDPRKVRCEDFDPGDYRAAPSPAIDTLEVAHQR